MSSSHLTLNGYYSSCMSEYFCFSLIGTIGISFEHGNTVKIVYYDTRNRFVAVIPVGILITKVRCKISCMILSRTKELAEMFQSWRNGHVQLRNDLQMRTCSGSPAREEELKTH